MDLAQGHTFVLATMDLQVPSLTHSELKETVQYLLIY